MLHCREEDNRSRHRYGEKITHDFTVRAIFMDAVVEKGGRAARGNNRHAAVLHAAASWQLQTLRGVGGRSNFRPS